VSAIPLLLPPELLPLPPELLLLFPPELPEPPELPDPPSSSPVAGEDGGVELLQRARATRLSKHTVKGLSALMGTSAREMLPQISKDV